MADLKFVDLNSCGSLTLTYQNFGQAFFSTYCTSCHSELASTAYIRSNTALIDYEAGQNQFMPRGSPYPTNTERAELSLWLECGAP